MYPTYINIIPYIVIPISINVCSVCLASYPDLLTFFNIRASKSFLFAHTLRKLRRPGYEAIVFALIQLFGFRPTTQSHVTIDSSPCSMHMYSDICIQELIRLVPRLP